MCVCAFAIACSPHPHCILPVFIARNLNSRRATPTCVKIVADPCPRLKPTCVSRGTLCVCVCVCHCLLSPPPLHPPGVHSPLTKIVGFPRLHASRLHPILARGSNQPVYNEGHFVCVCVCVCHCLLPPPPTASPRCS